MPCSYASPRTHHNANSTHIVLSWASLVCPAPDPSPSLRSPLPLVGVLHLLGLSREITRAHQPRQGPVQHTGRAGSSSSGGRASAATAARWRGIATITGGVVPPSRWLRRCCHHRIRMASGGSCVGPPWRRAGAPHWGGLRLPPPRWRGIRRVVTLPPPRGRGVNRGVMTLPPPRW